jgi:hypothetical protein
VEYARKPYRRHMFPPIREGFDRLSYFPPCSLDTLLDRVDYSRKRSWRVAVDRHNSAVASGNHDQTCYLDCPFIGDEYPHYIIEIRVANFPSMWRVSTFRSDLRP